MLRRGKVAAGFFKQCYMRQQQQREHAGEMSSLSLKRRANFGSNLAESSFPAFQQARCGVWQIKN